MKPILVNEVIESNGTYQVYDLGSQFMHIQTNVFGLTPLIRIVYFDK